MTKGTPYKDLTGQVFGKLQVLSFAGPGANGKLTWHCRCDCGVELPVKGNNLRTGNTKSCGCLKHDGSWSSLRTHGLSGSPAHRAWKAAKQRCFDPNAQNYRHYGGRGITMAPDWRADFVAFLRDMGQPPEGRPELDRIDPNGNYEPGNCRWASRREQVCNTSRTVWVEHDGTRMVLKDFAASVGLTYSLIQHRRKARGLVGREINGSALL